MRRDFFAQVARFDWLGTGLHLPVEKSQLRLQHIDLLLLPINRAIEFLDQMLGQAGLDFQFGQAVFHQSVFLVQGTEKRFDEASFEQSV
jgi:hypothetical protein